MSYFPPPPPAPPPVQNYAAPSFQAQSNGFRGRGRGGHRGRGGQAWGSDTKQSRGAYPRPDLGSYGDQFGGNRDSFEGNRAGYNGISNQFTGGSYGVTAYPSVQQPQTPHFANENPGYGRSSSSNPQPVRSGFIDAGQTALQGPPIRIGYDPQRGGITSQLYQQPAHQHRMSGGFGPQYRANGPTGLPQDRQRSPNDFYISRGRGQKRDHSEAFSRGGRNQGPSRGQAPPAVPNFGGPIFLPAKPPPPQADHKKTRRKRKRTHNQLGLTPKAEEHESSEEEGDDENEEARLSAVAASGAGQLQLLQINYRGRTSTLQSSSEIAAWIEERKRKFPTKAKAAEIAEKKRQREEAQQKARQVQKEQRDKQVAEARDDKRYQTDGNNKHKKPKEGKIESEDAAIKAKRKIEKLRKQLEKEEKRVAKAEAMSSRAEHSDKQSRKDSSILPERQNGERTEPKRLASPDESNGQVLKTGADLEGSVTNIKDLAIPDGNEPSTTAPGPLTPTSQPPVPSELQGSLRSPSKQVNTMHKELSEPSNTNEEASIDSESLTTNSSSDVSSTDSGDITSSGGSSDSSEDSGDGPEEATSKRDKPETFLLPKREKLKKPCRSYMQNGRCRFGDSCRFKHELPERGSKAKEATKATRREGRKERVSLYQRLVEQEKKNEEEVVLKAIMHLGEQGILDQSVEERSDALTSAALE